MQIAPAHSLHELIVAGDYVRQCIFSGLFTGGKQRHAEVDQAAKNGRSRSDKTNVGGKAPAGISKKQTGNN
jgi:hypothetical protein